MKRFTSVCLALASVVALAAIVHAARPQYGGTLRVEIEATIKSLDPIASATEVVEATTRFRAMGLVFETLVAVDEDGLRPLLATAWESDARAARWRFRVRSGVRLHDGSLLESWQVAAALRASEPGWTIATDGDTVVIGGSAPMPELPWVLTDLRHAVVARGAGGALIGTGPFRIEQRDAARISLRAHDAYWRARPFVDLIQIDMGRAPGRQLDDLEAGRTDIVMGTALDARRLTQTGLHIAASRPLEVVAMVFEPHRSADASLDSRRTLSAAINRTSMRTVLLQQLAESADALVPSWLSGYAPLFALDRRATLTRTAVAALPLDQREMTLRVDAGDRVARAIADRVAVDAREAGFAMTVQAPTGLAPRPDARIVRVPVPIASPGRALSAVAERVAGRGTNAATVASEAPVEAVYQAERQLLDRFVVIPIVHLPDIYGISDRVSTWNAPAVRPSGEWNFSDVWLRSGSR